MKHSHLMIKAGVVIFTLMLAGCASKAPPKQIVFRPISKPMPQGVRYKASFDCNEADSALQDVICKDDPLAGIDRDMFDIYRADLRAVDLVGRMQLIANQRRWLVSRAAQCKVPSARLGAARPDPAQIACLRGVYTQRIAELVKIYA